MSRISGLIRKAYAREHQISAGFSGPLTRSLKAVGPGLHICRKSRVGRSRRTAGGGGENCSAPWLIGPLR